MRVRKQPLGNSNISGSKIERIRKTKGLKQKYITEKMQIRGINMTVSSLSKIEGQLRQVCDYELAAIADILDVPVAELLSDD